MRQGSPDATAAPTPVAEPRSMHEYGTYGRFRRRPVTTTEVPELQPVSEAAARRRRALPPVTALLVLDGAVAATVTLALQGDDPRLATIAAGVTLVLVGVLGGYGLDHSMTADAMSELRRLGLAAILATWIVTLVDDTLGGSASALGSIAMVCVLASCLVAVRASLRLSRSAQRERVVVVGSGRTARRIMDLASRHPERRFQVVGVLDDEPGTRVDGDPPVVGRVARLPALLSRGEVDRVVVALGTADDAAVLGILRKCDPFGVPVDVLPRFFELIGHRAGRYRIGATPMLTIKGHAECALQRHVKRCLDVVAATTILALIAFPCLIIAALIKRNDHGRVLFRQRRIGKDGKPFDVLKFRTMVAGADRIGDERIAGVDGVNMTVADAVAALKPHDDPRVTRVGRVLRASSLDELPQLVNVLKGDMSLVGPRPLRDFEVDSLAGWERDRLTVRPGMTGLWQVSGRSAVDWEERVGMDYLYVRHWSLSGDMRILCDTVPALLGRRGAH
jgi:exopolysaccharide biosynthesis polyprenyl glycosylphosphotransferase